MANRPEVPAIGTIKSNHSNYLSEERTLEQFPIRFPVWELPGLHEQASHDEPHLDQERRLVGVSVHHGQPFVEGPGAIVTSYDPRLCFVDRRRQPDGHRFDVRDGHCFELVRRGPMALGRAMARRFTDALIDSRMEALSRFPTQDVFIQCGNVLVPALELGIGIPEATVIVSADLLTHPIALGFWQRPTTLPVLEPAGFDWE